MKIKTLLPPSYGELDVQFPRYSEASFGDEHPSHHYRRVTEANGRLMSVEITLNSCGAGIEIRENMAPPEARNVDYILGFGEYESSELEYTRALEKARSYFDKT